MKLNSRGEMKIGCVLAIAVVALIFWAAYKGGLPYYNAMSFRSEVEAFTPKAAIASMTDKKIVEKVIELSQSLVDGSNPQPVKAENVRVNRTGTQLFIEVDYNLKINLGFYSFSLPQSMKYSGFRSTF